MTLILNASPNMMDFCSHIFDHANFCLQLFDYTNMRAEDVRLIANEKI